MIRNTFKNRLRTTVLLAAVLSCTAGAANAEEKSAGVDVTQANNPLANFTAFNMQNYYIGELTDQDKNANQLWLRFAKPFSIGRTNWLMRASLPVNTFPVSPVLNHRTGIGDLNVFAAYLIDIGNPKIAFGIGPQITVPTASVDALGSCKWSAGLTNVLFNFSSPKLQYGYLLNWQASFAGGDNRADVNLGTLQPFMFYQLGGGTYLRSSALSSYNFQNNTYSVPVGLGVGQVMPGEKIIYNLFIEPQVSIADNGAGWPKWQIFVALNMQFK
ncbi:MAG: hypothetical protein WCG19_07305 [Chlorobiaceae bacterium]